MELDIKKVSDPKGLTFDIWSLKTRLGQFGPEVFGKRLIRPLIENPSSSFLNKTSFSLELEGESN